MRIHKTTANARNVPLVAAVLMFGVAAAHGAFAAGQIAITIDDLDVNADDTTRLSLDQRNNAILSTLQPRNDVIRIGVRRENRVQHFFDATRTDKNQFICRSAPSQ